MPEESAHWRTLGLAHYRAGEWQKALEALSTSFAKARPEEDPTATLLCLSMACCRLKQYDRAKKYYDEAAGSASDATAGSPEIQRLREEAETLLGIGPQGHDR
jgi:uncharacterized protein HemY